MNWTPEGWSKAKSEALGIPLFFDFEAIEAKAKRGFSSGQRRSIEDAARWFVWGIYPDAALLSAKELRRQSARIINVLHRLDRNQSLEPLAVVLEKVRDKGLEFARWEIHRTLEAIRTKNLSRAEMRELIAGLVTASYRLGSYQGHHTRQNYYAYKLASRRFYDVYREAGGKKRYGRYPRKVTVGRRGETVTWIQTYADTGETLDFIEEIFKQLYNSCRAYFDESRIGEFRKSWEKNTPPGIWEDNPLAGCTHRRNIAEAIRRSF